LNSYNKTEVIQESGKERISQAFKTAEQRGSAALMPYFTLGFPNQESSLDIVEQIAPYSDFLELGVPFSDPIADGPSIQRSTQIALENGITTGRCLEMVEQLRGLRQVSTPILFMGYYNPILAYGEKQFVNDAASVGVDGLIVPDLPMEEAGELTSIARQSGIVLTYFLAPTSSDMRIKKITAIAEGFIYLVSVTGVTGARTAVNDETGKFVRSIKKQTSVPVAVGFGISTPQQARHMAKDADGIIFGSALIDVVSRAADPATAVDAARNFVIEMRNGVLAARS